MLNAVVFVGVSLVTAPRPEALLATIERDQELFAAEAWDDETDGTDEVPEAPEAASATARDERNDR